MKLIHPWGTCPGYVNSNYRGHLWRTPLDFCNKKIMLLSQLTCFAKCCAWLWSTSWHLMEEFWNQTWKRTVLILGDVIKNENLCAFRIRLLFHSAPEAAFIVTLLVENAMKNNCKYETDALMIRHQRRSCLLRWHHCLQGCCSQHFPVRVVWPHFLL